MATAALQTFVEDRLSALVPGIDISPGSPAQLQFIAPLIDYLGTDPFETDIEAFLSDRFTQEYPDIYASNAGAVRDTFIKPLILMLDPFKRETQSITRNQSLQDPTVLSDDDADALAANFFASRDSGKLSHGTARILYTQPTSVSVDLSNRAYTDSGLGFYAITPMTVSAEEMAFNRSGLFYYIDIPVQAEAPGAEYNIDPDSLVGIDGLFGFAKVTNLQAFVDGFSSVDTPTFIAATKGALTEQSLVSRRGATARLNNDFQGLVQAVQVIGAGDPEMQRDILVADVPGQAWATGQVMLYPSIGVMLGSTFDDSSPLPMPVVGDEVYVYLNKYQYPTLAANKRFLRLRIDSVLLQPFIINDPHHVYSLGFLFQWSDPDGVLPPDLGPPIVSTGGFLRQGTIHVSSIPDLGSVDLTVANGTVHVYGHSDIYVRPVLQKVSTTVFSNLADDPRAQDFQVQRSTLNTAIGNTVTDGVGPPIDPTVDFTAMGVQPGDLLTILTGSNAGTYVIGYLTANTLYLTTNLSASDVGPVRYQITKNLTVNPFEPKIPKLPFGGLPCNDLSTAIGSNVFNFSGSETDLLAYGVKVGDTIRVLENVDKGDFTVVGFSSSQRVTVDRPVGGSNANLHYQIFTKLSPLSLPLVRIKSLDILDSSQKSTGYSIPYAKPLAIVPTSDFTSAKVRGFSQRRSGFVAPNLSGLVSGSSVAATSGDRRYSMGFDPVGPDDIYRAMTSGVTPYGSLPPGPILAEFLFPGDAFESNCYFVAICESDDQSENFPPIDPKAGDALTLKSGPNAGSYTIDSVRKFKYLNSKNVTDWVYFIKIKGSFPADPILDILFLLETQGVQFSLINKETTPSLIEFPDFFTDLYKLLPSLIQQAINNLSGTVLDPADLTAAVDTLSLADYEWGDPARGVLRSFFAAPLLFQQHTADSLNPTHYSFKNAEGVLVKFRPDPNWYDKQEILPGRLTSDTDPLNYPRDMVPGGADESAPLPARADFTNPSKPTIFAEGVHAGDVLSVQEEIFFHGSTGVYHPLAGECDRMTAVGSLAGSAVVTAPLLASGSIFTSGLFNDLLAIDEGVDKGMYRILQVVDGFNLTLDKPLMRSTPAIRAQGAFAIFGYLAGVGDVLESTTPDFQNDWMVGNYITIYGVDSEYQGSYRIASRYTVGAYNKKTLILDRVGRGLPNFPALVRPGNTVNWVITAAPDVEPVLNASGKGTELYGLQPIRIYSEIPSDFPITTPDYSASSSGLFVTGSIRGGVQQPYRIYRPNLRRVNPTEMALNYDGAYCFFDTQVISLGPSDANNIPIDSYLTVDEGTYESEGYLHEVDDRTLTYSMQESGVLKIPTKLLPLNVPDTLDSYLNLVGAPVQVSYESADVVQQVQAFLSSADDRVTTANLLARHLLPTYVSYDAKYTGGSAGSVIAQDIIDYINNLAVETPIDVSEIEKLIDARDGNPVTPTKVFLNLHDWSREEWLEFSENEIGGTETAVPYDGTPRVSCYIPGPDMSGVTDKPVGERINLVQQ
jgi:hypothetical protein